jgi:hypothetical protein
MIARSHIPPYKEIVGHISGGSWEIDLYSDDTWQGIAKQTVSVPMTAYATLNGSVRCWGGSASLTPPPSGLTITNISGSVQTHPIVPEGVTTQLLFPRYVNEAVIGIAAIASSASTASFTATNTIVHRRAAGTWR